MTEETGKNSPKDERYTNILYISKMSKVIFLSLLSKIEGLLKDDTLIFGHI
jgi:hypothetical protein